MQLLGKTRVGAKCLIRSFTVIENCPLGDNVLIRQSCVLDREHGGRRRQDRPVCAPAAGSEIGEDAHVGNFVETKKAKLGKGAKASHLTYLGDAEVGEGTNIGAGVITCNYDGVHKHRTQIGKAPLWAAIPPWWRRLPWATERISAPVRASPRMFRPDLWRWAGASKW